MSIFWVSFAVFGITLAITKGEIFSCQREFVEKRYERTEDPRWIHTWWHAIWTCPMCCGYWVSFFLSIIYFPHCLIAAAFGMAGLNWLWHIMEDMLIAVKEQLESESEEN